MLIEHNCSHFGSCGGCTAKHLSSAAYSAWKEGQIAQILQKYNIKGSIDPIITCPLYSRRRIELLARRINNAWKIGFSIHRTHEIVEISECHIALPQIINKIEDVKSLAQIIGAAQDFFRINLLWTEEGLDISFKDLKDLGDKRRMKLIEAALKYDIARLSLGPEILIEQRKPYIKFGGVAVNMAPASFVQAVELAEQHMVELALQHLSGCKKIIDLFAGAGAFTFPCLSHMSVHAVEVERKALESMQEAYDKQNYKLKMLSAEQRDLFLSPMAAKDLNKFDGLIFDPPRAGAAAQCAEIAKSDVRKIVAISCNINSLAIDLKILQDGGYIIEKIIPIDQFVWSAHCEIVVLLSKKKKKQTWKL